MQEKCIPFFNSMKFNLGLSNLMNYMSSQLFSKGIKDGL